MPARKIVHIDMDAFYASVEQRDDPQLRGKPVVVAWRGNRSVVCAASYEARRFGVWSAMPAVRAERLCPTAVFLPPDFPRYRAVSRQVREILKRHMDLIEPLSLDEAYLDVSENKTGLLTATQVARTIREHIRAELALTASAGVAPNKFLAKIASDWRKPDGMFVIRPEEVDLFLLPLPVGRLPGVGKVTEEKLKGFQVQTVADLRVLDLSTLERRSKLGPYRLQARRAASSEAGAPASADCDRLPQRTRFSHGRCVCGGCENSKIEIMFVSAICTGVFNPSPITSLSLGALVRKRWLTAFKRKISLRFPSPRGT
jgi:DNA polymerase-4